MEPLQADGCLGEREALLLSLVAGLVTTGLANLPQAASREISTEAKGVTEIRTEEPVSSPSNSQFLRGKEHEPIQLPPPPALGPWKVNKMRGRSLTYRGPQWHEAEALAAEGCGGSLQAWGHQTPQMLPLSIGWAPVP